MSHRILIAGRTFSLLCFSRNLSCISLRTVANGKNSNGTVRILCKSIIVPGRECSSQSKKESDNALKPQQERKCSYPEENKLSQEKFGKYYKDIGDQTNDLKTLSSAEDVHVSDLCNTDTSDVVLEDGSNISDEIITVDERFPTPSEPLNKDKIYMCLKVFYSHRQVEEEAKEHGLDRKLFVETFKSFKQNLFKEAKVDTDLHNVLYELQTGIGHVDDLLPFFLSYAKRLYPVLDCLEDLTEISDFRGPPELYPQARSMKRKIIFHAGPTNSGKTHKALERFHDAKSGIYCGPLRLLASEVHQRTNDNGIFCDLITGEERRWAVSEDEPSNHLACTVEMCSISHEYECAVIDEIQMITETERGFAWTKALLGLLSSEIHVCGEPTAIDLVKQLVQACGDEFVVCYYERLTPLEIESCSLDSDFSKITRGDCVIAFSQRELYRMKRIVESSSKWKCAIVYGGLPPATKVDQARRFNDPDDNCKVLIASDAVGMGLNLNIRRIVFSSMKKFDGKHTSSLSSSQVKQIAGRAGRFGMEYDAGLVTTLHKVDLPILQELMSQNSENIKVAGIAPTMEQVEMFSYQLPKASLKEIFETFCGLSRVSSSYFICSLEKKKVTADIIENVPLSIRDRYTLCISPHADSCHPFATVMLLRFARSVSSGELISAEGLQRVIGWPPPTRPTSLRSMQELEVLHDSFDLYLWLSYRYPDIFVDRDKIRAMQNELMTLINHSLSTNMALTGVLPVREYTADISAHYSDKHGLTMAEEKQDGHNQVINKLFHKNKRRKRSKQTMVDGNQDSKVPWWDTSRRYNNKKATTLTEKLLQDKILTRHQLKRLQEEWRHNFMKYER